MENTTRLPHLHALCALRPRVTALRLRALLDAAAGDATQAWNADRVLLQRAGWSDDASATLETHRHRWDVPAEYARLATAGLTLLPLDHPSVPPLLRKIYDPPIALYVRGTLPGERPAVAVVGSRKATLYGRTATQALVRPLASRGLVIVSGLAYGIDAEAHRATLAVHGITVGVLGGGADAPSLYPRAHRQLAEEIVAGGGAVVSEFPPGTESRAEFFPQRNRVIAGMSAAVVVAEAAAQSGALITARLALEENREVFAVPGPITAATSQGTNRLLREGAAPALSAEEILEALALRELLPAAPPTAVAHASDTGTVPLRIAERLLGVLSGEPRTLDDLLSASNLPAHEVSAALTVLELDGRVRDVGNKQYVKV